MSAIPGAERIPVEWTSRGEPLSPTAVVALGAVAVALARRLLREEDERLARLHGVSGTERLVVLGSAEDLPWVSGVHYLGKDPEAPSLLLPTTLAPSVPAALLASALVARFPSEKPPLAVLPETREVISVQAARPRDRTRLEAWLAEPRPSGSGDSTRRASSTAAS